VKKEVQ